MARRRNRGGRRRSGGGGGGGGGGGRRRERSGPSAASIKSRARTRALVMGGLGSLGFGFLQSKVELPGFEGVPNSLTYGAVTLGLGLVTGSDALTNIALGPFFAGVHGLGLHGFSGPTIAGTDGNPLFPEIGAADFADIGT